MALRINVNGLFRDFFKIAARLDENKFFRCLKAAVEINGANQRFECIGQCRCSLAPATGFFSASHQKIPSQIEGGGVHLQCFTRYQPRAQFRQLSFSLAAKMAKKILGDDELEDGATEKFQALIIKMIALRFVAETRMRERLRQQQRIAKLVTDAFLERSHRQSQIDPSSELLIVAERIYSTISKPAWRKCSSNASA